MRKNIYFMIGFIITALLLIPACIGNMPDIVWDKENKQITTDKEKISSKKFVSSQYHVEKLTQ